MTFIRIALLLSAFNFSKLVDKDGNFVDVPGKFEQIVVL
jgi:hypothetical protein